MAYNIFTAIQTVGKIQQKYWTKIYFFLICYIIAAYIHTFMLVFQIRLSIYEICQWNI